MKMGQKKIQYILYWCLHIGQNCTGAQSRENGNVKTYDVDRRVLQGRVLGLWRLIAKALLLQHKGIKFASCVFVQQSRERVSLPIPPFPFEPYHCQLLWTDLNTPGVQDLSNEEEGSSGIISQHKKERSVHVIFYGEGQTSSIHPRIWCGFFPIFVKLQNCLVLHMRQLNGFGRDLGKIRWCEKWLEPWRKERKFH